MSEPIHSKICTITDYTHWADIIHLSAVVFHAEHGIYPNILLAHKTTFDKIDKQVNNQSDNLFWQGEGIAPKFKNSGGFACDLYSLDFCIENKLSKNTFKLVFDDEPIFDGEVELIFSMSQNKFVFKLAA